MSDLSEKEPWRRVDGGWIWEGDGVPPKIPACPKCGGPMTNALMDDWTTSGWACWGCDEG